MILASETLRKPHKGFPLHNLFFAVMVPGANSNEFTDCLQHFQKTYPFRGKPIETDRLHLSVYPAYRGEHLPREVIQTAIRAGNGIRLAPFSVTFDRALTYRNRKSTMPFVLTAQESSEAVNALHFQIGNAYSIMRGGLRYRYRPIDPHITLVWDNIVVPK